MKSGCCRKFLSAFGPLRSCLLLGGRVVWVKGKLDRTVPQSVTQQLAGCDFCKSISKLSPPTLSTCSRITRSSRLVLLSVAPWLMLSLWKLSLSAVASVMKAGVRGVGDLQGLSQLHSGIHHHLPEPHHKFGAVHCLCCCLNFCCKTRACYSR